MTYTLYNTDGDQLTAKDLKAIEADVAKAAASSDAYSLADVDTMSLDTFIIVLRDGYDESIDDAKDIAIRGLIENILRNHDVDMDDADADDFLNDMINEFQQDLTADISRVAPSVLVLDHDHSFEYAAGDFDELKENFQGTALYAAVKDVFSEKQVDSVLQHYMHSGGGIYLGIITDSLEFKPGGAITAKGDTVLVSHNFINGDADYVEAKGGELDFPNGDAFVDAIDSGSYSVGAIFGTRDWKY